MHANKTMVTDVLKGELGFGGFVGSDYNGCFQDGGQRRALPERGRRHVHDCQGDSGCHRTSTTSSAAARLVTGIPMSRLDDAVRRILSVKCEMGLFDSRCRWSTAR